MRDYRDAKTMAKGLRRSLAALGTDLTHSQSLELIAQAFGFDNWNILAAKIEAAQPAPADEKRPPPDEPLHCSFCGKPQQDVKTLIAGPNVSICNECVGLCDDIVDDSALEKRVREGRGDGDAAAEPDWLTDYTPEQLSAYLTRVEHRMAESQKVLDGLDADEAALPDWLKAKAAPERAQVRARLVSQAEKWRTTTAAVARALDAR